MLFLAKLFGILTLIWFYLAAKNNNGPVINWSIIGLIGWRPGGAKFLSFRWRMQPKHSVCSFADADASRLRRGACYLIRKS